MSTVISFGSTVLLASAGGTYQFTPGGEGRREETKEMPDSESNYVQDLGWRAPNHRLSLSLWVATAGLSTMFTTFDTLMAAGIQTLTIPDYGTYPYCRLKEPPVYNKQSKRKLPGGTAGYQVTVDLVFEPTRSRYS